MAAKRKSLSSSRSTGCGEFATADDARRRSRARLNVRASSARSPGTGMAMRDLDDWETGNSRPDEAA